MEGDPESGTGRAGPPARPARRGSGVPLVAVVGAALLAGIGLIGSGAWLWVRSRPAPPPTPPVLVSAEPDAGASSPAGDGDGGAAFAARDPDTGVAAPPTGSLGPPTGVPHPSANAPTQRPSPAAGPSAPGPGQAQRTVPSRGPAAPPTVVKTLESTFERAERARRAGRREDAKRLYEDVIRLAWDEQVPMGDPAAKLPARARMALGDLAMDGVRPIGQTQTSEELSAQVREVTGAYSKAARHYGRVGTFGHLGLAQCGLVRSAEASLALRDVVHQVRAPHQIAKIGPDAAQQLERGFREMAKAYLETAANMYEAASRIPNGDPKCGAEAREGLRRVLNELGRRVP